MYLTFYKNNLLSVDSQRQKSGIQPRISISVLFLLNTMYTDLTALCHEFKSFLSITSVSQRCDEKFSYDCK